MWRGYAGANYVYVWSSLHGKLFGYGWMGELCGYYRPRSGGDKLGRYYGWDPPVRVWFICYIIISCVFLEKIYELAQVE